MPPPPYTVRPLSVSFTSWLPVPLFSVVPVEVIVVQRNVGIVALNQTSAGRVILGGRQRQAGVLVKRIDGLHQSLAEGGFAHDQAAVMVLNRARHDFRR